MVYSCDFCNTWLDEGDDSGLHFLCAQIVLLFTELRCFQLSPERYQLVIAELLSKVIQLLTKLSNNKKLHRADKLYATTVIESCAKQMRAQLLIEKLIHDIVYNYNRMPLP